MTHARKRLTLIVCTRNRLPTLRAAIVVILGLQCRAPWQLVVVDNGSTDGTWQWIRSIESTTSVSVDVVSEPVVGLSRARNAGLRHARGDIVAFTDDDCYPTESYLNDLLDVFSAPGIDYCGGRVVLHDPADLPISTKTSTTPRLFPPNTFIAAGAMMGANMAFSRPLLDAVGPFDVVLGAGSVTRAGEDIDFLFRASSCGFTGIYSPTPTVRHHHGRRSNTDRHNTSKAYDIGRGAYYAKHLCKRQTNRVILKNWYWRTDLRSVAGIRRFLRELHGAASYLCNVRGAWRADGTRKFRSSSGLR